MAAHKEDFKGLKCPQPVLKIALLSRKLPPGTLLEVTADCPTFPQDVRKWCTDNGKVLITVNTVDGVHTANIQL